MKAFRDKANDLHITEFATFDPIPSVLYLHIDNLKVKVQYYIELISKEE